jgi:hypothetical protein
MNSQDNNFIDITNNIDEISISWFIDKCPNFELLNNLQFINENDRENEIFNLQNIYSIQNINEIEYSLSNDDFIPFDSKPNLNNLFKINITSFSLSDEDCSCCICMNTEQASNFCQLNCAHNFCTSCTIENIKRNSLLSTCPLCRKSIVSINVQNKENYNKFI